MYRAHPGGCISFGGFRTSNGIGLFNGLYSGPWHTFLGLCTVFDKLVGLAASSRCRATYSWGHNADCCGALGDQLVDRAFDLVADQTISSLVGITGRFAY